jgi:hypothetical protein
MDAEKPALLRFLDAQRGRVFVILDGLSEDDLRRVVLPSGWSCLELVHHWPDWQIRDVRWVVLHMIEETARHLGHLDAARELLDGRAGLAQDRTKD